MQGDEALKGMRILLVEDEPIVAWDLAENLKGCGCEIVGPAFDLAEAQELVTVEAIDCAILDINLGKEKVFPLADRLAERAIPFCFVTGYGLAALRPSDNGRPVLQKPIALGPLVETVARWRKT